MRVGGWGRTGIVCTIKGGRASWENEKGKNSAKVPNRGRNGGKSGRSYPPAGLRGWKKLREREK